MDLPAGSHLLDYWAVLRRRRWVVYLSVATVALVALVGSFVATPLYRATATLQIERQNPDILSFRDLAKVDHSWAAYTDYYQTQYKILASEKVSTGALAVGGLAQHPAFAAPGAPSLRSRIRSLLPGAKSGASTSDPTLLAARKVQGALEVAPIRNSHLVEVSWVSPDPVLAAQVANAVTDAYILFSMELQSDTSAHAAEFLGDQVAKLKDEIGELESKLQVYGESKKILSIDDSSNITLRALADVSQRRTETQTALAKAQAVYRAVTDSSPEALPEVLHSALIERLRGEYAAYEAQYSEKSKLFKSDWPAMQTLASKMEQAKARLDLEIGEIARQVRLTAESEYRRCREEIRNLDALMAGQEQAAQSLKRDSGAFVTFQTEVQKKREALNSLIARQNEMSLAGRLKDVQSASSNIRVVDSARTPEAPFRPNKKLNVLLGLVLGTALGVGAAFFLEYLDNSVHSAAEVQRVTGLPTLAVVPRHGPSAAPLSRVRRASSPDGPLDLVAHLDGRARVSEAYRELRTALLLSNPGRPPRLILVTSALPEEGKSATAVNLAIVLAQLGRRIVLVDTDLRRPRLHAIFDRPKDRGISTFLSGLEPDPLRLAVPTGVEHLDLVTSGPVPPNPSELLNSRTFAEFGARFLENGYDHVVYDSPPVLAVSDPAIIASVVESVVLVIRAESTPKPSLRLAVERFAAAGSRPAGVVLNDLDLSVHGQPYYAYYGHDAQTTGAVSRARRGRRTGTTGTGAA